MKAKLIVVGGDAKAAEIKLKLPTVIGRGREANLALPHPLVSRKHCELYEHSGKLCVRDLGSLNGTYVNNERITDSTVLPSGDLLTVGSVTFRAVYSDQAPLMPPAGNLSGKSAEATVRSAANRTTVDKSRPKQADDAEPPLHEVAAVEDAVEDDVEDVQPVLEVEPDEGLDVDEFEGREIESAGPTEEPDFDEVEVEEFVVDNAEVDDVEFEEDLEDIVDVEDDAVESSDQIATLPGPPARFVQSPQATSPASPPDVAASGLEEDDDESPESGIEETGIEEHDTVQGDEPATPEAAQAARESSTQPPRAKPVPTAQPPAEGASPPPAARAPAARALPETIVIPPAQTPAPADDPNQSVGLNEPEEGEGDDALNQFFKGLR